MNLSQFGMGRVMKGLDASIPSGKPADISSQSYLLPVMMASLSMERLLLLMVEYLVTK